jgi:hypothetical protein
MKTHLMKYLSSVYFVILPLYFSGIFVAHPPSGGILYIYNDWYVLCFSVDCLLAGADGCYAVEMGRHMHQRLSFSASGYVVTIVSVFIFVVDVVITGVVFLVQAMMAYGGCWRTVPVILNLDTRQT